MPRKTIVRAGDDVRLIHDSLMTQAARNQQAPSTCLRLHYPPKHQRGSISDHVSVLIATSSSNERVACVEMVCAVSSDVQTLQNEELPWERKERLQNLADKDGTDLPFAVYLIGSAIIAIAAV